METKDIKDLMLSNSVEFFSTYAILNCNDIKGNCLYVYSRPEDSYWSIKLYCNNGYLKLLTDEQYNMICKHVENEYYEHHNNNTAFTDEDIEHFNSLIN
jgi:hypothetical protein